MAIERPQALQDTFLDHLHKHDVPVTIFLTNGIRLQGYVGRFDSYSVLLVRDRQGSTSTPSLPSCPESRFTSGPQTNKGPPRLEIALEKFSRLSSLERRASRRSDGSCWNGSGP